MRAANKEPADQLRERYLGEIAPLLEAARQVDMLSPGEKKQVRKRIARTLFGTRSILGMRGRLVPVLVALALLVFGGAAFATAQRLGLLPRLGGPAEEAPAPPTSSPARKRKGVRATNGAHAMDPRVATAEKVTPSSPAEPQPLELPALPDPMLVATPARVWVLAPPASVAPSAATAAPTSGAAVGAHKEAARTGSALAMAASPSRPAARPQPVAPVMPAPGGEATALAASAPVPAIEPAPAALRPEPLTLAPVPAPIIPAPVAAPPTAVAPTVAAPVPATKATKPVSPDQALFGQALRKLRADNDPAGALASLHEHAREFPKSALGGERLALEVEALLALHREGDALALLDLMALDELPRSGERLVVRGELRAAAQRWREASADFDRALARVSGSPSWHERALWGRGAARLHMGDRAGGLADIERYRATYPRGRFIGEAVKIVPDK